MDVVSRTFYTKKAKQCLAFFCFTPLLMGCGKEGGIRLLKINYTNEKAISVDFTTDIDVKILNIFVDIENKTPVLGHMVSSGNKHSFIPVIPFSKGQAYVIRKDTTVLTKFTVKSLRKGNPPEIIAIYPSSDTVPENLLKMYIAFSHPMQRVGRALDFIKVTDSTNKEVDVFLALENELWNKEHNLLTLWLDPGRIKTDLIPNRERGLPIRSGNSYTIHISDDWKSAEGIGLVRAHTKKWIVIDRDSQKPILRQWDIAIPKSSTKHPLSIDFKESLDAVLLKQTIDIMNSDSKPVSGNFKLSKQEHVLSFYPQEHWENGAYTLRVESRLEDVAGNNLNHLFDTDLKQGTNSKEATNTKSISITIK